MKKQRKTVKIDDVIDFINAYLNESPIEHTAEEILQDMKEHLIELKDM